MDATTAARGTDVTSADRALDLIVFPAPGGEPIRSVAALVAEIERAGVTANAAEVVHWLAGVAQAAVTPDEFVHDPATGLAGHELAVLDFDPTAADRLRRIGRLVAAPPAPDIQAALAIAGSAAQGRIQPFPLDLDFFERVDILAPTLDAARLRLADLLRANIEVAADAGVLILEDVHLGRGTVVHGNTSPYADGAVLTWSPAEIAAGVLEGKSGQRVSWEEAASDPGFIKLAWHLGDSTLGGPVDVSKVIDAVWEAPDGTLVSLDGSLDADCQQVYLDPPTGRLARAIVAACAPAAREFYLQQIGHEVRRYLRQQPPDHAKAAKRLYNLCRLTGRHAEAIFLRELFDEPPARLLHARELLAHALRPGSPTVDVGQLLEGIVEVAIGDEVCADVATRCRSSVGEAPPVTQQLMEMQRLLAERADEAFRLRLHAYPPVKRLLTELLAEQ